MSDQVDVDSEIQASFHDLRDVSVFITGGGSGIGAAFTDGFMAQHANVTFVQRSDASIFVEKMQQKHGRRPNFVACDITDLSAVKAAVSKAQIINGPISILINNAADDDRHVADELTEEYWDRSQDINLKSYFFVSQAVAPQMRAIGGGSIINLSSISYIMGNAGYVSYTTANAGINGMTRSLAREWGGDNIRVNAIAPGWVLTERQMALWYNEAGFTRYLGRQCLKRALNPNDIVGGALFLASKASSMITGQTLVIDAGVVVTG